MAVPLYLWLEEKCCGPYTETEIRALLQDGRLLNTQFAWMEGLSDWIPVSELLTKLPAEKVPAATPTPSPVIPNDKEIKELQAKIASLETDLRQSVEERRRSEEAIQKLKESCEKTIASLKMEAEARENAAREKEREVQGQRERREKLEAEIAQLRSSLQEADKKSHSAHTSRLQAEEALGDLQRRLGMEHESMRTELAGQVSTVEMLKRELANLTEFHIKTTLVHEQQLASSPSDLERIETLNQEKKKLEEDLQKLNERMKRETEIQVALLEQFERELKSTKKQQQQQ